MTNDKHLNQSRMVFIGRGVAWKNGEFIISSLRSIAQKNICAILVLPSIESEVREILNTEFSERIEFEIGIKFEDFVFTQNDMNVYPVDYGLNANFIESISLKCLELVCLGVPSLVSKDGCGIWPELERQRIIKVVDWKQIKV